MDLITLNMHPIIKIRLTAPKAGYISLIRFEKPTNETGIDASIIIRREVIYGTFKECLILMERL